eukprot:2145044-Ditylum_brightwellii.AAC.1
MSDEEDYTTLCLTHCMQTFGGDGGVFLIPGFSTDGHSLLMRRLLSIGMSNGCNRRQSCAVIDPGAEEELIRGNGLHILHYSQKTKTLAGAIKGMGQLVLSKVDAVAAVLNSSGKSVLIRVGNASCDCQTTQYELLLNLHHLQVCGAVVDNMAKKHGDEHQLVLKGGTVLPLDFNGYILTFNLRPPTPEELMMLEENWL